MKFVSYLPAAAVSSDCSWRRACLPPPPTPHPGLVSAVHVGNTISAQSYATHWYRYWYWVLVSAVANTIGYWVLGGFLGIVLTLLGIN